MQNTVFYKQRIKHSNLRLCFVKVAMYIQLKYDDEDQYIIFMWRQLYRDFWDFTLFRSIIQNLVKFSCNNCISFEHFSFPDYFNDISHINKYDFENTLKKILDLSSTMKTSTPCSLFLRFNVKNLYNGLKEIHN